MDKAYEYRLYPTAYQRELMAKTFGCCRWVYNKVLAMRQDEYRAQQKTRLINAYITQIPLWKKTEEPWLAEADSMALQQSLRDLDRAYKNFFRNPGKVGFPRFKSKRNNRKSYRTNTVSIVGDKQVKLPKLGAVKARISRPIEGRVLSATVKQVPSGKYYVTICCTDVPCQNVEFATIEMLGIDAGIHDIATCSTGKHIQNPKNFAKSEKKLAREQRKLSRKQKGSQNREKQRVRVARVHERIANQRKDTLHKFTTAAVSESQAIAVENLNVSGMRKNHCLAKAISDASMSEMIRQLEYKCAWQGRDFVKVGRFFASSKTCSTCGYRYSELTLAQREWKCPDCAAHHDRDVNAAINIACEGIRLLKGTAGLAGTSGVNLKTLPEQV
ncbi:MAG: IS200/IS605 family element RNA-guided endonuclease TnpB [Raoultibacter sp.]